MRIRRNYAYAAIWFLSTLLVLFLYSYWVIFTKMGLEPSFLTRLQPAKPDYLKRKKRLGPVVKAK